ncbi:MAG: oligopeptide/dipeptide ABC transporter ATP-binding protein, partial [Lachnospira sp.]
EVPAKELLENPLHPYTKGLMAAVARLDDDKKEFVQIPGHLPDPADKPAGCYFHPRCPYAATACKKAMPLLTQNQQGRKVRCYEAGKFKE